MELPRYQEGTKRADAGLGAARQGIAIAGEAEARLYQTLGEKLEAFTRMAVEPGQIKKAQSEALQDIQNGVQQKKSQFSAGGRVYNKRLNELTVKTAQNDIKRKMDEIELKHGHDSAAYTNAADGFLKGYLTQVPGEAKTDAYVYSEALKVSGIDRVSQRQLQRLKEAETAQTNTVLTNLMNDATNAAYNNNSSIAKYMRDEYQKKVSEQIENGLITADEGRRRAQSFDSAVRENIHVGSMDRLIESGDLAAAKQFFDDYETGTYEDYGTEERNIIAAKMKQRLNTAFAKQNANKQVFSKNADISLGDATKVYKNGKIPTNLEEANMLYEYASDTKRHEFDVAKAAHGITSQVSDLSLPNQMATVNSIEQKKDASRIDIEALNMAKQSLKEKMALAEKDPISLGVQDGMFPQTATITPANIGDAGRIISMREQQAGIANAHYGVRPKLFQEAEAQQFTSWLQSPSTSIKDKLDFIQTIEASAPNSGQAVYNQLLEKGNYEFAAAADAVTEGDMNKGEMILRGHTIAREMGNQADFSILDMKISKGFGNAFMLAGEGTRRKAMAGARSYYLALAEQSGRGLDMAKPGDAKEAVEGIVGKKGNRNGMDFFAPQGVDPDDVSDYFDDLKPENIPNIRGVAEEQKSDLLKRSRMVHVGDGKYQFVWGIGQDKRMVVDEFGSPLTLEYVK